MKKSELRNMIREEIQLMEKEEWAPSYYWDVFASYKRKKIEMDELIDRVSRILHTQDINKLKNYLEKNADFLRKRKWDDIRAFAIELIKKHF